MKTNLKKWMGKIDDEKQLFALTIPGAHDCTTKNVCFPHISKCQKLNVRELLNAGIRALDIRVAPYGNSLKLVHGFDKVFSENHSLKQMDLGEVLEECYAFLDENPQETIIFQFKNDSNKQQEECFDNLFYSYIKPNKNRWYCENRVPLIKEARGRLVLLRRCNCDTENKDFCNDAGIDFSGWVEQDTISPEPLKLETSSADNAVFIIQDRYKYKPLQRWNECLKPFLDSAEAFKGEYIINYTSTAGGVKGPENNAGIINEKLMKYSFEKEKYYGIVYLDFATPELTAKLIEHNSPSVKVTVINPNSV